MPAPAHKIIIAGTGRAGTTFLVQLLTELGLDTGYAPFSGQPEWGEDYFEHCAAGLEQDPLAEGSPTIVKNPRFCETLPTLLATGRVAVDHALIPIRELAAAAQSRIAVGGDGSVPGGLWGTADPEAQQGLLAENFHRLMHTLAEHDIPHTLLLFPRFARDPAYAYAKLGFLAPAVDFSAFEAAFRRVSHPEMIHRFGPDSAATAGQAAAEFLRRERRKRTRRRVKRGLVALAILAAAAFLYFRPGVRLSGLAAAPVHGRP